MAGKQHPTKPPGAKNRVSRRKMLKFVDKDTGLLIANIRWRPRGELYVEHAAYVKPQVVSDPKS